MFLLPNPITSNTITETPSGGGAGRGVACAGLATELNQYNCGQRKRCGKVCGGGAVVAVQVAVWRGWPGHRIKAIANGSGVARCVAAVVRWWRCGSRCGLRCPGHRIKAIAKASGVARCARRCGGGDAGPSSSSSFCSQQPVASSQPTRDQSFK